MRTDEVRKKYLDFFKVSPRNHTEITPAPLVLPEDPTTLFTSSGMQPLVPYLMGQKHPMGKRLVNSQPSIRVQDIEEVGDNRHTTYFEMLGNWSLGDYFKEEQLAWFLEFLTGELSFSKEKLWVSVFEGDKSVPKDTESVEIWKKLGIPDERIFYYDVGKNWWSRSGIPDKMPVGEIGGPDSEVFYDFGEELRLHEKSKWARQKCHPNCDCGRFLEIGNSVFIQYRKEEDGSLKELPQKNVDFGGGLERLTAVTMDTPDIFKIDVFANIISEVEENTGKSYEGNEVEMRVIADHLRACRALIEAGVIPSNKMQGYVLRRLIRRSAVKMRSLKGGLEKKDLNLGFGSGVEMVIEEEVERFGKSLERGVREIEKAKVVDGRKAFDLYQSYGFPWELTVEIAEERGQKIDRKEFEREFGVHQDKSRSSSVGMFKGGLADKGEETVRLHTATHLLHAALRKVLGGHVSQKGSNITAERLRFDFSHGEKLSDDEIKKIEDLVNEQIDKDLEVTSEVMRLEEAKKSGALAFFGERYDEKVKVYTIGSFSREVCGGPHVARLSELGGHVRIVKQESAGAGVRRIYAHILP